MICSSLNLLFLMFCCSFFAAELSLCHVHFFGVRSSFTASTYSTNIINAAATKVRLNGVDVTSKLWLSTSGPSISGMLPGSAFDSYTVYNAQIEVQDQTGGKRSTNTFWFDTFSEAFLGSTDVKIIEAENYNYSNGVYLLDPIPVSGPDVDGEPVAASGVGYSGKHGIEGVDLHDNQSAPEALWAGEYRPFDPVGLSQGMYPELEDANDPWGVTRYSDQVRDPYATNHMVEFVVHRTEPGEWLNYTRHFDAGKYHAWLRVASFGSTEVLLDRVTSDPTLPGQTTVNLGSFSIPNQLMRCNYRYLPLVDNGGSPVALDLSGTVTLRLAMAGTPGQDSGKLAINYLLLAPVPVAVHLFSSATMGGTYTEETGANVDAVNRTITVPASGSSRFYRLGSGTTLTIRGFSVSGGIVTIKY